MKLYYAASGRPGELQIVLPKGGYIPEFSIAPISLAETSAAPETVRKPDTLRKKIIVSICLLAVAIAAVLFLTRRDSAKPAGSRILTAYPGYPNTPAFSPDGQTIAFSWGAPDSGDPDLYVQRLDADTPRRLTDSSSRDRRPVWLPDGEPVGFLRDDGPDRFAVIAVPLVGAGEQRIATLVADSTTPPRIEWSHDGRKHYTSERMAPHAQQRIVEIDLQSGGRRNLTQPVSSAPLEGVPGDDEATLSPDGKSIAFRRRSDAGAGEVFVEQIGGEPRQITHDNSGIVGLVWTRDGGSLIEREGSEIHLQSEP